MQFFVFRERLALSDTDQELFPKNVEAFSAERSHIIQELCDDVSPENIFAPLTCNPNFLPFHGGCFSINTKNFLNWQQALAQCNLKGGTLAKISREGLRYAFSNMLERMKPRRYNLHIGLLARDDWVWIDGSPLNPSLWMPGNPTSYKEIQGCAVLSAGSSRIKNENCGLTFFPLCQKKPGTRTLEVTLQDRKTLLSVIVGSQLHISGEFRSYQPGIFAIKIIFEGEGFLNNEMSVAVDDVILTTEKCSLRPYFAKPGGFVASLPAGGSELPSSLSSPIINTKAYEWKCLRFWYFIGSDHANDWHTASLMVLLRQILSNQTVLLFFVDEVTNKARYTQIPLPSNYTNAKIFNGNSDQDTVVWHTLNSSITARYIRFRPEAWHGHISMRVELYGCQEGNVGAEVWRSV
ncbi:hypothetical protein ACROYT_G001837 [Oculina patagonica]